MSGATGQAMLPAVPARPRAPVAGAWARHSPEGESGYAIVVAVVAIAVLALMSIALIDGGRSVAAGVAADAEQARLAAAAEAGLAVAMRNLGEADRSRRWTIDSRPRNMRFAGTDMVITIEDERGKVPLNQVTDEQVRTLLEMLGLAGPGLDTATDSVLDWLDVDDEVRQDGAERQFYAPRGHAPRNDGLRSLDEMVMVRGVPPGLVERLDGLATTDTDSSEGFDDRFASPLALAVISGGGLDSPLVINRTRERAGQRVAIELAEGDSLVGRPLTIRVDARRPGGSRLIRAWVVELTGRAANPYVVRARRR